MAHMLANEAEEGMWPKAAGVSDFGNGSYHPGVQSVPSGLNVQSLFEDGRSEPLINFSWVRWETPSPFPGTVMPEPDTTDEHFNGMRPHMIPEQVQTARRFILRKRTSAPLQVKLPTMETRLRVKDGRLITPPTSQFSNNHTDQHSLTDIQMQAKADLQAQSFSTPFSSAALYLAPIWDATMRHMEPISPSLVPPPIHRNFQAQTELTFSEDDFPSISWDGPASVQTLWEHDFWQPLPISSSAVAYSSFHRYTEFPTPQRAALPTYQHPCHDVHMAPAYTPSYDPGEIWDSPLAANSLPWKSGSAPLMGPSVTSRNSAAFPDEKHISRHMVVPHEMPFSRPVIVASDLWPVSRPQSRRLPESIAPPARRVPDGICSDIDQETGMRIFSRPLLLAPSIAPVPTVLAHPTLPALDTWTDLSRDISRFASDFVMGLAELEGHFESFASGDIPIETSMQDVPSVGVPGLEGRSRGCDGDFCVCAALQNDLTTIYQYEQVGVSHGRAEMNDPSSWANSRTRAVTDTGYYMDRDYSALRSVPLRLERSYGYY